MVEFELLGAERDETRLLRERTTVGMPHTHATAPQLWPASQTMLDLRAWTWQCAWAVGKRAELARGS